MERTRRTENVRDLSQKRAADACKGEPGRRTYYWDAGLRGFGLRVDANGVRSWLLDYRHNGRHRRMSLGLTSEVLPATAHKRALELIAGLNRGVDPLAERELARSVESRARADAVTVADIASLWLDGLDTAAEGKSTRWPVEARRLYEAHVERGLGAAKVRDVEPRHVMDLVKPLAATPPTQNRVLSVVSAIMQLAIRRNARPASAGNPASRDAVDRQNEDARDRYLSEEEWPRLAKALVTVERSYKDLPDWDTRPSQLRCILLIALTGARRGAVMPRLWTDVDWAERALRISPAHKGASLVYLGAPALALLRTWHEVDAHPHVFPGQSRRVGTRTARGSADARPARGDVPISSLATAWRDLVEAAELGDFTPHDLRRSFATAASDMNVSEHLIGGLLSHSIPGVKRRYAKRTDRALLEAADVVAAEVARRLKLDPPSEASTVTPIGTRRAG